MKHGSDTVAALGDSAGWYLELCVPPKMRTQIAGLLCAGDGPKAAMLCRIASEHVRDLARVAGWN